MKYLVLALIALWLPAAALSQPIVPGSDAEVVETLPSSSAGRREDRRLRRQLAENPQDATLAVRLARQYLERSRDDGDPRHAGQALGVLSTWRDNADAPVEVLLMLATLQQHLHDFDGAAARLEQALARDPRQAQGWLTLATVRRVQGRYDASDAACERLVGLGAFPYGAACLAENDALRGRVDAARAVFAGLVADNRTSADQRAWLLTTRAEIEQRAGMPAAADQLFRAALREPASDLYAVLAYADLLLEQQRAAEVAVLLKERPRSDAVQLRLALAEPRGEAAAELRRRIDQVNQRPGTASLHGREQAMFALGVDADPVRALTLARDNVRSQREPIDLLVFAKAARAAGDTRAIDEARALIREVGLQDRRIDALL